MSLTTALRGTPHWVCALLVLATSCWADPAQDLLHEQLATLTNSDILSTIKVLQRVGKFVLVPHKEDSPPAVPAEMDRRAGFIVFVRNYLEEVYYNTQPRPSERVQTLAAFATPDEYEPLTFALCPLGVLNDLTVTCTDLTTATGAAIPAAAVDVRFVRQLARGAGRFLWTIAPEALETFDRLQLPADRTTQFWLTVHVPPDGAPGEYHGVVRISARGLPVTELPLQLVVLPFRLQTDPAMTYGWYLTGTTPQTLPAVLADMRAHGFNAVTIGEPSVTFAADGTATGDFSSWERWYKLLKDAGMTGIHQSGVSSLSAAVVRQGPRELGPGFDTLFVAGLRAYKSWLDAHPDFHVVFTIFDEPRETLLNSWNRNFDDTVDYISLCRQVPGLRISVNPMGDTGDRKDYTPFVGLVDVLNTHAWKGSEKLIALTRQQGKPLWVYNNGYSRLAWGFSQWKLGSQGNWQWAYFAAANPNAYSPIPIGGFENEGESNTGRGPTYCFPDRIVPTPRYEWVREGIDDYRYLYTLLQALKRAPAGAAAAIDRARKLLQELSDAVPEYPAIGLQTGTEAGGSGDPARLMAMFDHFRWRIALAILELQDIEAGRDPQAAGSLWSQFSRYPFGQLPNISAEAAAARAPKTPAAGVLAVEKTVLSPGAKLLYDFETDDCLRQLETDRAGAEDPFDPDLMPARCVADLSTYGKRALFYQPQDKAGGLHFINFDGDWRGFDVLRMDLVNPTDRPVNGYLCITDANVPLPYPRAMGAYDDRFDLEAFIVPPGKYTLEVDLGGLGAKNGRLFDMSRIAKIALSLDGNRSPFYVDCIRLEKRQ